MYRYYFLVQPMGNMIYRMPDGAFIPIDTGNTDYVAYLAWCKSGNIAPEITNTGEAK